MTNAKAPSPWKRQITLNGKFQIIRAAARAMGVAELVELTDPIESEQRKATGKLIDDLIFQALEVVAQGAGEGYQLHQELER